VTVSQLTGSVIHDAYKWCSVCRQSVNLAGFNIDSQTSFHVDCETVNVGRYVVS